MNEIVNRLLLAGYKFMPEIHLLQPGFLCTACSQLNEKRKKEYKSLKKQKIQDAFIKVIQIKAAFNKVWLMKILKIYREEKFMLMVDISLELLQWLIKHFDKVSAAAHKGART